MQLGGGLAENKEVARSHVDNKRAYWWGVSDRLVCSLALTSCRHLALATCDSVPYGVWPPIAGVYHRACPTGTGQLGGSAYGPNCKKPSDWLPMLQRGGDKMDKDQKLSAEEYNHKNNVTFSSDTKTAPSGPFSYGVFECRVLRQSRSSQGTASYRSKPSV